MKIKAIYENNVLKPLGDLNLPNKSRVNDTMIRAVLDTSVLVKSIFKPLR